MNNKKIKTLVLVTTIVLVIGGVLIIKPNNSKVIKEGLDVFSEFKEDSNINFINKHLDESKKVLDVLPKEMAKSYKTNKEILDKDISMSDLGINTDGGIKFKEYKYDIKAIRTMDRTFDEGKTLYGYNSEIQAFEDKEGKRIGNSHLIKIFSDKLDSIYIDEDTKKIFEILVPNIDIKELEEKIRSSIENSNYENLFISNKKIMINSIASNTGYETFIDIREDFN